MGIGSRVGILNPNYVLILIGSEVLWRSEQLGCHCHERLQTGVASSPENQSCKILYNNIEGSIKWPMF